MSASTPERPWWSGPLDAAFRELASNAGGLSEAQAAARLGELGPNVFGDRPRRPLALQFLARFRNPLVIVLLAASAIAAATGEVTSFSIIGVVILISITLDFVQEHRADQAAEKLRQSVSVRVAVVRDGTRHEIPIRSVVPGDVVQLAAGDVVPADGRVIEARDFFLNQALLTGEPFPVEKHAAQPETTEGDALAAPNTAFMGTSVISGTAKILVCRTGARTQVAAIAKSLTREPPPTDFETGTRRFGLLIMRLTVLMVLFVLLVNTLFARPLVESFLFAVALAVGLTPELLPMIVTVTLARGALRLAAKRVIVKRLASIQNLGSMNLLCTDKTGTLTEARIRLERHVDAFGTDSARVLELAFLNSYFETGLRSPLDDAILTHEEIDVGGWRKIDEVPFDFERRRVSVLLEREGRRLLVVKGAPEDILRLSVHHEVASSAAVAAFNGAVRGAAESQYDALGRDGFRVLAIAWRETATDHSHAVVDDETELVFAGFAAFLDPPKDSAASALRALADHGVAVKILTGDNERVTEYICGKLGMPMSGTVTGTEISRLDDAALAARAETANLFCRVTPAQKSRIILALKARGHVVGYLGDGINDAPSLHNADVGLSVDTAVDVAKQAAHMILLDHDLNVLHEGVMEGRRTFRNIMKYIMMGTSSNFGNMFSMAGAALVLPFLPMTPAQILLNNMLYDVSEVPIPLDRVDDAEIRTPRRWDMTFIRNFMLIMGPVSSLFDFLTFYVLLEVLNAGEALFRTGWFVESLATQVLVIFIIRTRGSPLAHPPHPLLVVFSLGVVALAVFLPFTPVGHFFGFVPPPVEFFYLLAALSVGYLAIAQAVKIAFYRRFAKY